MQIEKNKKKGVLIMLLGVVGFFFLILLFQQSGSQIQYKNIDYMLKMLCTYGFLLLGLSGGLFYYSGKKLAIQIGGGIAIFLTVALILGFLLH